MELSNSSLRSLWRLRLGLGALVLLGSVICFLGTSWDIQWHTVIGRDRILIPPHLLMLGGVALGGIGALSDVLVETIWARRNPAVTARMVPFAGLFNASLGAYVAGFAALCAAVAFPLDAYWHALYGIDVSIWAPFHIMILGGMGTISFGGAYMLASAARLAAGQGALTVTRLGYLGAAAAFAAAFDILMLLVLNGIGGRGMIDLGVLTVDVFPLLATILCATMLVVAVQLVPWRWAATSVALIGLVFVGAVALLVPPATDALVGLEHQQFLRPDPGVSLVALRWPLLPVLAAVAVDVVRRVRRSDRVLLAVCCLLASLPVIPARPLEGVVFLFAVLGTAGAAASLLLGLAGALWGTWLGGRAGPALAGAEAAA